MADLIDREEFIRDFDIKIPLDNDVYDKLQVEHLLRTLSNEYKKALRKYPKADTERHAHWIKSKHSPYTYKCSKCGAKAFIENDIPANYCIECGCKMDKTHAL